MNEDQAPWAPKRELTDHDLLIRIDERVRKLDRCMTNHLRHHWAIMIAAVSALLMMAATLLGSLLLG